MRSRREWTLDCTYVEVDAKASAGIDRKFQKAQDLRRQTKEILLQDFKTKSFIVPHNLFVGACSIIVESHLCVQ